MSEKEPISGRIIESFNPEQYPEFTHCTVIEESADISRTISIMDANNTDHNLVVPFNAVRLTNIPDIALLRCRLSELFYNPSTAIVVPTTSGELAINILTKYIARKR